MRLCRFGRGSLGVVEEGRVRDVTSALDVLPACRYPLPSYDLLVAHLPEVMARVRAIAPDSPSLPLEAVDLLAPVANPGKIVAAPVNYQKHFDEVQGDAALHAGNAANSLTIHKAGLFLKATSSLVGPSAGITLRRLDRRTDHEVELVVVIGRTASRVAAADALHYVAGYAVGLDISIRGTEDRSFRKSADSYSVLGPWLATADEIPDPAALALELRVNGELRQQSSTSQMTLGVPQLVEMASACYTLYPGDLIFTGTPEGVSPIEPGDLVDASIDRVGRMRVSVHAGSAAGDRAAVADAPASA